VSLFPQYFQFWHVLVKPLLSVREVKIKHDLTTRECKYTLLTRNERFVWENEQYLYNFLPLVTAVELIWIRWPSPTWRRKWSRAYVRHVLFTRRFRKFYLSLNRNGTDDFDISEGGRTLLTSSVWLTDNNSLTKKCQNWKCCGNKDTYILDALEVS